MKDEITCFMAVIENSKVIPPKEKGAITGAEEHLKYDTHREALAFYELFKQRFLHVNSWKRYTGKTGIKFEVAGIDGNLIENEMAREGLLIRIGIPGSGPKNVGSYDWVRIETITDEYDPMKDESRFSMRVRAVHEPGLVTSQEAHFLTSESTNTFTLKRIGTEIIASVNGKNEKYDVKEKGFLQRLRNVFSGFFSSAGGAHSLWKIFLKGILEKK